MGQAHRLRGPLWHHVILLFMFLCLSVAVYVGAAGVSAKGLPTVQVVLVGVTGDLSKKYLVKSMLRLQSAMQGSVDVQLHGAARSPHKTGVEIMDAFIDAVPCGLLVQGPSSPPCTALKESSKAAATYTNVKVAGGFDTLCSTLQASAGDNLQSRVFFLAIPPKAYGATVGALAAACDPSPNTRYVLEKPFGSDAASAQALMAIVLGRVPSEQVFLVDHYLGKAPLASIPAFRTCVGGAVAAGMEGGEGWHLSGVQAAMLEASDVQGRTWFYHGVGVVRDVLQNHATELALAWLSPAGGATEVGGDGSTEAAQAPHDARASALHAIVCAMQWGGERGECAHPPLGDRAPVQRRELGYEGGAGDWFTTTAQSCAPHQVRGGGDCGVWGPGHGAHITAGEYGAYAEHVRAQQGPEVGGFTPTAAHVALSVGGAELRGHPSPPLHLSFTAGKALASRLAHSTAHFTNGTGEAGGRIMALLHGSVRVTSLSKPVEGPALILQGPLPAIPALLAGWAITTLCSSSGACDNTAVPSTDADECSTLGSPLRLPAGAVAIVKATGASRHAEPLSGQWGDAPHAFAAYLRQHALDVPASASSALGSVQAYTNVLAGAVAGDGKWFVDPSRELPGLWALWDPIVAAGDAVRQ